MADSTDLHTPDNYAQKLTQLPDSAPVSLRPGEFLRYVLLDQHPVEGEDARRAVVARLAQTMGFTERALAGVVLAYARPNREMAQKLGALSGTAPSFWIRDAYMPADAIGVTLDLTKDIETLNRQYRDLYANQSPDWHVR